MILHVSMPQWVRVYNGQLCLVCVFASSFSDSHVVSAFVTQSPRWNDDLEAVLFCKYLSSDEPACVDVRAEGQDGESQRVSSPSHRKVWNVHFSCSILFHMYCLCSCGGGGGGGASAECAIWKGHKLSSGKTIDCKDGEYDSSQKIN